MCFVSFWTRQIKLTTMALINCPDCNTQVSDKAIQCPKCAFPISQYFSDQNLTSGKIPKTENVTSNVQQPNLNQLVILSSRKNEGIAFVLTFLFGPFGLLYANPKKAAGLIIATILSVIACAVLTGENVELYNVWSLLVALIFWITSIVLGLQGVSQYNNSLLETDEDRSINFKQTLDPIDQLRLHIKEEKFIPFYAPSRRSEILQLLNNICDNQENAGLLLKTYTSRYNRNLIEDLKGISASYGDIHQNISKFIEYGFVDTKLSNM